MKRFEPFACFNWADVAVDFIMQRIVWLPLEFTVDIGPVARIIGLAVFAVWCIPALIVCMLPMIALMVTSIIIETWKGEL